MGALIIYYRDGTSENFKSKSKESALKVIANRGDMSYCTFNGVTIHGKKPVKTSDRLNEIVNNGDLEAFDKFLKNT